MASCRSSRLWFFSRAHWPSTSGRMISTTCLDLAESSPLFGCSDFSLRAMPNMPVPRCLPAEDDGVRGVHQATVTDSARGVVEIRSRQQSPVLATIGYLSSRAQIEFHGPSTQDTIRINSVFQAYDRPIGSFVSK